MFIFSTAKYINRVEEGYNSGSQILVPPSASWDSTSIFYAPFLWDSRFLLQSHPKKDHMLHELATSPLIKQKSPLPSYSTSPPLSPTKLQQHPPLSPLKKPSQKHTFVIYSFPPFNKTSLHLPKPTSPSNN